MANAAPCKHQRREEPQHDQYGQIQPWSNPGHAWGLGSHERERTGGLFFDRHSTGDWGQVCPDDAQLNEEALKDGGRIISAYSTLKGVKLWIITEATDDNGRRASTTILLPSEY